MLRLFCAPRCAIRGSGSSPESECAAAESKLRRFSLLLLALHACWRALSPRPRESPRWCVHRVSVCFFTCHRKKTDVKKTDTRNPRHVQSCFPLEALPRARPALSTLLNSIASPCARCSMADAKKTPAECYKLLQDGYIYIDVR
jgi:hypothetical protein